MLKILGGRIFIGRIYKGRVKIKNCLQNGGICENLSQGREKFETSGND